MFRKFRNLDKVEELEVLKNTYAERQKWWNHQDTVITAMKKERIKFLDKNAQLEKDIVREKADRLALGKGFKVLDERHERLKKENEELELQIETQAKLLKKRFDEKIGLEKENEEWKQHNKTLAKTTGELNIENEQLEKENEHLKKQVHDLRELNKRLKKGMKK